MGQNMWTASKRGLAIRHSRLFNDALLGNGCGGEGVEKGHCGGEWWTWSGLMAGVGVPQLLVGLMGLTYGNR